MLKTVSCICYLTIMSEVTRILSEIESGDMNAADQRQAAESLGLARRTADRHWAFARAWLCDSLEGD